MIKCPNCGITIHDESNYCDSCGYRLTNVNSNNSKQQSKNVRCSKCGMITYSEDKFCSKCGNSLNPNSNNIQQNYDANQSNNKNIKYFFIIGIIIFLMAIFFFGNNDGEIKELQIENTHMYCQAKLPSSVHNPIGCEIWVIDENNDIYSSRDVDFKYISDDVIEINTTFFKDIGNAKPKELMFTYTCTNNDFNTGYKDFEVVKYDIKDSQIISY